MPKAVSDPIGKQKRSRVGKVVLELPADIPQLASNRPSVILHIKCFLRELDEQKRDSVWPLPAYSELDYGIVESNGESKPSQADDEQDMELTKKLRELERRLHHNNVGVHSACFWCTHDFLNPPVYIPKHHIRDSYHVYGCFCGPECATAFLMRENIDSSARFERYALLNQLYGKIYDYSHPVKPAPDPHYMLDRFCGNLSIAEYRALFKTNKLLLVLDKPLTRLLPEIHEDNDEKILNTKVIPSASAKKRAPPACKYSH